MVLILNYLNLYFAPSVNSPNSSPTCSYQMIKERLFLSLFFYYSNLKLQSIRLQDNKKFECR